MQRLLKGLKEHQLCFRLNQFVERYLKIKSFATKITLMFLVIFIISLVISTVIFSILNIRNLISESRGNIKLATKIRQEISQKKLDDFAEKIEVMIREGYIDKVKNHAYVKNLYEEKDKTKREKYILYEDRIKVKVDRFVVEIDKSFLYDIIKSKWGIVSKYNPRFELGDFAANSDLICSREKFTDSNFYLVGCLKRSTIINMAIL